MARARLARGVSVGPAKGSVTVRFTLGRAAKVRLRIETTTGVVVRDLAPAQLDPGTRSIVWDGRLPKGTRAYGGSYIAHLFATSSVGTCELSAKGSSK